MPERWDAADAYEPFIGRWSRKLAPRFLDWVGLPTGRRALDVGCGTGALSEALVARGWASVVGIDPAPAFLDGARKRVPEADFQVGDAQALRSPDASFDAAVSGLVLNFVPKPEVAVREMRRVVAPGGLVAAYVWDYAGRMEIVRHFWSVAVELEPERAAAFQEGARFALCAPEPLRALFEGAGLRDVATGAVEITARFSGFDDYWTPFLGGQGPSAGYATSLPDEKREALRAALARRLPTAHDGSIELKAGAWAVRGRA